MAVVLGLGKAVEYAQEVGVSRIQSVVSELASVIRQGVTAIDGLHVEEPVDSSWGIVTLSSDRYDVAEIKKLLSSRSINTSVAHDYDGPLDLPTRQLQSVPRVAPRPSTTTL